MKTQLSRIVAVFAFCIGAASAFAQEPATASVAWTQYKVSDRNITISLPKFPTVNESRGSCSEIGMQSSYAYADGAVYELTIVYRSRLPVNLSCKTKPFNEDALNERLAQLRDAKFKNTESAVTSGEVKGFKFENSGFANWIFPQMDKKRWVELTVVYRNGSTPDLDKFSSSLDLTKAEGKDIGKGSEVTLGDAGVPAGTPLVAKPGEKADSTDPGLFRILSKPRAAYTEEARQRRVKGSVLLTVTLNANGSIGDIEVSKGLGYGMSEQAIAAARRIVFLPRLVNGSPVAVKTKIEYGFNIY